MKNSKLIEIFKDGNVVIPIFLIKNYEELGLELDEFIFLMYLHHLGNRQLLDPNKFMNDLNIKLEETMNFVSILTDKGFIQVDLLKNDKNIMEEVIILDGFYDKMSLLIMEQKNNNDIVESNDDRTKIFSLIEKELGRTLNSIEYDVINKWFDNNIKEELMEEALKEAMFSGVINLRYIDRILFEWGKLGIKTVDDLKKKKNTKNSEKNNDKNQDIDMDIVDWNWFDEDE